MSPMQEEGGGELSQATAVDSLRIQESDMMNMEYEEMDEEYQREHASMEDPRIVHALDCGPDELEDHLWLMHEF